MCFFFLQEKVSELGMHNFKECWLSTSRSETKYILLNFTFFYLSKYSRRCSELFKIRLSLSSLACTVYWSAEYHLVNEQHWWFHESVLLEKANRFATASKGQKNMRKAHECASGHVRTLPVLELTTSGYIECTGVKAIMLTSHPVVSWVEDKSFHRRNICLTWVLSRLLLLCLGSSLSCLSVPILCFNGRRDSSHVYLADFNS